MYFYVIIFIIHICTFSFTIFYNFFFIQYKHTLFKYVCVHIFSCTAIHINICIYIYFHTKWSAQALEDNLMDCTTVFEAKLNCLSCRLIFFIYFLIFLFFAFWSLLDGLFWVFVVVMLLSTHIYEYVCVVIYLEF